MTEKKINNKDVELYRAFQKSPIFFIQKMWKLRPQPVKEGFKDLVLSLAHQGKFDEIKAEYFQPFEKGKHITWQQWKLLMAVENAINGRGKKRISVKSGHGCHAINTPILMFNGTVKMVQDIKVGDKLMGDDNRPRNVLSLCRGQEKMYRIQYFDGTFYDVNESHILSLVASQSHGKQQRGDKTDIAVRDYLKWSDRKKRTNIGYRTPVEFSKEDKELLVDPYLLGIWLGDGSQDRGIIFNPDEEIAEYIFSIRDAHFNKVRLKDCPVISVPGLITELKELGLFRNKYIPYQYLTASRKQRLELLAGLLDSDGYSDGCSFEITQKRKELAEQIVFLAKSIGSHATIKKVWKGCQTGVFGEYYLVLISRNTWDIPTKIKRKHIEKPKKPQREKLNFGFNIIPLKIDDYYGFEIDGNNHYLLGDFTVTHNTGKSCTLSWLIIWYLFCHLDAQVPCTAPTAEQMHDILWKELAIWKQRMPKELGIKFDWTAGYLRVTERPETWFARAKTARKEKPEALAGVHGEFVFFVIDESSGVPGEIFKTAEGALTGKNVLVIMISNPTRTQGYFHDSFHSDKEAWQLLTFNSEESPIVEPGYLQRIIDKNGKDSDEYRIRVLGEFPREDAVDEKGYSPLLLEADIRFTDNDKMVGRKRLGIDPSGEGCFDDKTEILTDDGFVYFKDLIGDEKVLSINLKTDIASWEFIDKLHKYKHEGKLNVYFGKRGVNFAITDNHKLVVKTRKNNLKQFPTSWSAWKIERYDHLPQNFLLKRTNGWVGDNINKLKFDGKQQPNGGIYKTWEFSIEDWAEFLGWFVSEGSVYVDKHGHYNISIAQTKPENRELIKALLKKMKVGFKSNPNDFQFTNGAIGKHLLEHCKKYAKNKRIPKYIKEAKPDIIRIFLNSFILGDGCRRKNGGAGYYSSSKLLIDDLQECLIKLGIAGKITKIVSAGSTFTIGNRKIIRKNDVYTLWENRKKTEATIIKNTIKKIDYSGYVYCVTTKKYSTILVRRNGIVMWSGNSDESSWVERDNFRARTIMTEKISDSKSIAQRTLTLLTIEEIKGSDATVDNFGTGANVAREVALAGTYIEAINVGDPAEDNERFINRRAEGYWRIREWCRKGGEIVRDEVLKKELLSIRFKRNLKGKIQIMSKEEMRKEGFPSPNKADSLMLTFIDDDMSSYSGKTTVARQNSTEEINKAI